MSTLDTFLAWPLVIELPWPQKELNPNSREFWMTKSRIAKRYRWAAARATALVLVGRRAYREALATGLVRVDIMFHQPNKARRDFDNMLAQIKSGLDGVAMGAVDRDGNAVPGLPGLGVDDRHFRPSLDVGEVRKGGAVVLRLRPADGVCPSCGAEKALRLDSSQERPGGELGSLLD